MTDITTEQVRKWAAEASKYAETGWLASAAEDHPQILRRFAELARQDEREAADRYRWLRAQNWNESELCVVADPKRSLKLGCDCPSGKRLDEAIDRARGGDK